MHKYAFYREKVTGIENSAGDPLTHMTVTVMNEENHVTMKRAVFCKDPNTRFWREASPSAREFFVWARQCGGFACWGKTIQTISEMLDILLADRSEKPCIFYCTPFTMPVIK